MRLSAGERHNLDASSANTVLILAYLIPAGRSLSNNRESDSSNCLDILRYRGPIKQCIHRNRAYGVYGAIYRSLEIKCLYGYFGINGRYGRVATRYYRFYTVRTVRAARWSGVWRSSLSLLLYTTAPAIGVFAKYNLIQSLNAQPLQEVRQIDWVSKWENTGLLVLEDKNGDGIIEYSGDKAANEVTIDRDIIVLSTPEVADLAPFIIALVAAGGLAAALSTAAGLILAMSSAVSHDLYYRILKTDATERQRLRVARIMIVISVITAVIWGQPAGL